MKKIIQTIATFALTILITLKNLHMKTKLILFSLVTILFTTCTIDETDSGNAQFSETEKTKLYQLANKYGVKFRIRDKEKNSPQKASMKEAEEFIKLAAAIQNAKFEFVPKGKNQSIATAKIVKTRSSGKDDGMKLYTESGAWSGEHYMDTQTKVEVSITWEILIDKTDESVFSENHDVKIAFTFAEGDKFADILNTHSSFSGDVISFTSLVNIYYGKEEYKDFAIYDATITVSGYALIYTGEGQIG